jgi:hypothetical protein
LLHPHVSLNILISLSYLVPILLSHSDMHVRFDYTVVQSSLLWYSSFFL